MTYGESETEHLARRINGAINFAIAVAFLAMLIDGWRRLCPAAKKWCLGMLGSIALWLLLVIVPAVSMSSEEYIQQTPEESDGSWSGWMVFAAVMAGVCLVGMLVAQGKHRQWQAQQPPAAPAPPVVWAPQPSPPPGPRRPNRRVRAHTTWVQPRAKQPQVTQTVVERSVRVVRATSATTTHQNPTEAPTAPQGPHNVIAPPPKQLTVVTGRPSRPTLHTEDHGSYTSFDRRSFDRDIEEGPA